jgi:hypothetical protein
MRSAIRLLCITLAATTTFLAASAVRAAEPLVVAPGTATTIISSTEPITDARANVGMVTVVTDKAVPKPDNTVLYVAPAGDMQVSDDVVFKLNGVEQTVPIDVRNPAPVLSTGDTYAPSFKALFELFIVAVLLESGLALVFNWKPFLTVFDPKAVNAIVSFAFATVFVMIFNFDIVGSLLGLYAGLKPNTTDWAGRILTAMIVAGGSAGVNRLFQSLGFRAPSSATQPVSQKPPSTVAWIAVTPLRKFARGPITVLIGPKDADPLPAVGIVTVAKPNSAFLAFLLRNPGRFPPSGGHALKPGEYKVSLAAKNGQNIPISPQPIWGPYMLEAGAVIDLELEI